MDRRGERPVSSKGFAPDQMLGRMLSEKKNAAIGEYKAVEMTNLWLLGWSIFRVGIREGAVGLRKGEGVHWILLDRPRLHHLLPRVVEDDVRSAQGSSREHSRNFFQKPFGLR